MKQIKLLGVLAIALTLGLAACNGPANNGGDESKAGEVSECAKHQWGDKEIIKAATCTEPGQSQRTCKVCGAKEEPKEIKALGHDYKDVEEGKVNPTCTQAGSKSQKCSRCGDVKQGVEIPALGHDFQDLGETAEGYVAPGYGTKGVMPQKCSRCDATQTRAIDALTRGFTISSASFAKAENKVYLRLAGTCDHYTQENFKWAFALQRYNSEEFLTGKAEPAAEDFNIPVTLTPGADGADDSFTVDFDLTSIVAPTGVEKVGNFSLMAGPADNYKSISGIELEPGNLNDGAYRYYFRNDQEVGSRLAVCIDEVPPYFFLSDAVPSFKEVEGAQEAWVAIKGEAIDQEKSVADLQAELDAVTPFIQFQSQSNSYYRPEGSSQRATEGLVFNFTVAEEGGKKIVSLNIRIQFMIDANNTVYNTHLNLKNGNRQANCVMDGDFSHVIDIPGTERTLEVFSHPDGANDVQNSYGNLGFRTADKAAE